MEQEQIKRPASFVVFGITGAGKSTFCNTALNQNVFIENDGTDSETTVTRGEYGLFNNRQVYVVDTPGLQDSEGRDQQHLNQMIDFIKQQPIIQAFVFVIDFTHIRIDQSVIKLFQLIEQMYPAKKWYNHIAIVWSNYGSDLPQKKKDTRKAKEDRLRNIIKEKIKGEITEDEINTIPQYFIDSIEARDINTESYKTLQSLIDWISELDSLNEDLGMIENVDNEIQMEEIETKRQVVNDYIELNIQTIETALFERSKKTLYSGEVLYTDWIEKEGTRLKETKVLLPPPPDIREEYNEKIEILGERRQVEGVRKWGRKRYFLFGPKIHRKEYGKIFQKKRYLKMKRKIEISYDGVRKEFPWEIISDETKEEAIVEF